LAQAKSNFKLQLRTKVVRVVRSGSKVTGVEVETAPDVREIINLRPGGGVLLAAGVLSTPRVLFNSGIGRPEQINIVKSGKTKVKLPEERDWINLPVGLNVRDHSRYQLWFNVTGGFNTYTNDQLNNPIETEKTLYNNGSGVYTQSFMRMDTFRRITMPDGHNVMFQAHCASPENGRIEFTYAMSHGSTSSGVLSINPVGNTIFTKEPWTNTDADRAAWSLAINELFDMTRKPGSRLVYTGGRNATAASVLSTPVQQGVHYVGGAQMGTDDGRKGGNAVVDLNTKVYGTDNLFVVDGSFHPDLSTGNTQAIIMVTAEHAVQKIIALK
jgi:cellobiose dehydrogenase (acceptor)